MNKITYKGKEYPIRTFKVLLEGKKRIYTISVQSLWDAIEDKWEDDGSIEQEIDNEIYFYVSDVEIDLSGKEICKDYLDIEMEFVEELLEIIW